jgi:DNA-binding transcriptional ArsR family regulator
MIEKAQITRAIELCLAVYRVSELFPVDEVLKVKTRLLVLEVVEGLFKSSNAYDDSTKDSRFFCCNDIIEKIEVIDFFLQVASEQNWLDGKNFEVLRKAYKKLREGIESERNGSKDFEKSVPKESRKSTKSKMTAKVRELIQGDGEEILRYLQKTRNGASAFEVAKALKKSRRTVSRRIKELMKYGLVQQEGKGRSVLFSLGKKK